VISTLKGAYVAGMLAKDEFDLRVGQTLAARTYAELAAVTPDLPATLAAAQPSTLARAQGEEPMRHPGRMIAVATAVYAGPWAYVLWTSPNRDDNHAVGLLILLWIYGGFIAYLLAWFVAVVNMIALWREKRSGGQLPRGQAPGAESPAPWRLPPVGPGGQLPPADSGQPQGAEAAPIRRPRLRGWRSQATAGYLTHPA
jgi:hypothetical protein